MTLIETLNNIVVDGVGPINFSAPDGESDCTVVWARDVVIAYMSLSFDDIKFDNGPTAAPLAHKLCIYGDKLFDAIEKYSYVNKMFEGIAYGDEAVDDHSDPKCSRVID